MIFEQWLGYGVAVWCIVTYVWAASGKGLVPNLWANAVGGPIVAIGNAHAGYWPAVVLEVFFTLAGVYGLGRLRCGGTRTRARNT